MRRHPAFSSGSVQDSPRHCRRQHQRRRRRWQRRGTPRCRGGCSRTQTTAQRSWQNYGAAPAPQHVISHLLPLHVQEQSATSESTMRDRMKFYARTAHASRALAVCRCVTRCHHTCEHRTTSCLFTTLRLQIRRCDTEAHRWSHRAAITKLPAQPYLRSRRAAARDRRVALPGTLAALTAPLQKQSFQTRPACFCPFLESATCSCFCAHKKSAGQMGRPAP